MQADGQGLLRRLSELCAGRWSGPAGEAERALFR